MDVNTIVIIIAIFAAQSVPLALFLNLSKKIDALKDELTNVKDRLSKIESKLDIVDERYNNLKENIIKIETEQKEQRAESNNLIDKIFDFIKNSNKQPIL